MAINQDIDHDRQLITVKCDGVLTIHHLTAYIEEWIRCDYSSYSELWLGMDIAAVEMSFADMLSYAESAARADRNAAPTTRTAVVMTDALARDLARFFAVAKSLWDVSPRETRVFDDEHAARAWLEEPRHPQRVA